MPNDGKHAFVESTKRFFSMIAGVDVRNLIIERNKAVALTRYELQPP